jgi:hypothetical protein
VPPDPGPEFAAALGRNDMRGAADLLHEDVDFRALTPNAAWDVRGREAVLHEVFPQWWEEGEDIEELLRLETGEVSDRRRVGYLLRVRLPDGPSVVEQQAYYEQEDGAITWMRLVCSGHRPLSD